MSRPTGLRARLVLLVLLAVLPAFGVILYSGTQERRHAAAGARVEAERLTGLAASSEDQLISGVRDVLTALAETPEVRAAPSPACDTLLAALLPQHPQYATLGVIAPDGNLACSAGASPGSASLADRAYFRQAIRTKQFAVGEYQVGGDVHAPTIDFAVPVPDPTGGVLGVVFASVDLGQLNRVAGEAKLPHGASLIVVDRGGTILAREPDPGRWVGRTLSGEPVVRTILTRHDGTAQVRGLDSQSRLYAFTSLEGAAHQIFVSIGIPTGVAYAAANKALDRNLIALGVLVIVVLAAAYVGTDLFVLRRVKTLVAATERLAAADLGARSGLPHGSDELGHLGRSFDEMAAALQARQADAERARRELQSSLLALERTDRARRSLLSHLAMGQEAERSRIASDIHDDSIQAMTAVGIRLEMLRRRVDDPDHLQVLDDLDESVVRAIARLRHLVFELRPPALDREGLAPALRVYLEDTAREGGLTYDIQNDFLSEPPEETRTILYRIAQEALTNARRHGRASHIDVLLDQREGGYRVRVRDDGRGFSLPSVERPAAGHIGLTAMRERAELAGGWWRAQTSPGAGTTIEFWVPTSGQDAATQPALVRNGVA